VAVRPLQPVARVSARGWFFGLLVVLTITLVAICMCAPVQGDEWPHYRTAQGPLTWSRFAWLAEASYMHGNPRWGQLVLTTLFHERVVLAVLSALMIVAVLVLSMTLVRARWPRPSEPGDTWLLVQVLATAIMTTPQVGAVWFYRPNCTNYVYPLAVQLAWLVPYRFLAARGAPTSRWLGAAMVPLGLLAGAGNEHTGVGLAIAAVACMYIAWCRHRVLPAWSLIGIAALAVGYIALLAAPGQMVRYGGVAAEQGMLDRVFARGLLGTLGVFAMLLAWTSPMVAVVAAIAGRVRVSARAVIGFVAVAMVMVVTALAAPRVPSRMLAAPATMVAIALGVFMVELTTQRVRARRLRIASVAISGFALAATLVIFTVTGIEGRARLRAIEAAPRGSVVCAPPYTFALPTPFSWGDDFRNPQLVERVARAYGLAGIRRDCQ
jgi:hypothetical protein